MLLGSVLSVLSVLILFGWDKTFESWVVQFIPEFLIDLSGKY
jgi:hypothetical protein